MSKIAKVTTSEVKNFIASEVGLRMITKEFTDAGITADAKGKKTVAAGTIVGSGANVLGVVFEDVDVTDGDHEGSMIVAGHLLKDQLPTAPSSTEITAFGKIGLFFDTSDSVGRQGVTELGYTAEADTDNTAVTFDADDIATSGDGFTVTATAATSSDTAKATVAVSAGTVTVTPVANGTTVITVTLTDSLGSTYAVDVDCTVSNQS